MAESHRRVEPRGIVGTGMATDPDRIRDIEQRAARMERDYKLPHKRFGEVMDGNHTSGPPAGTEWVDAPVERQRRTRPGATAPQDPKAATPQPDAKAANTPAPVDLDGASPGPTPSQTAQAPTPSPPPETKPEPPQKGPRTRPMAGAANAKVGSSLGGRARVAFKV